MKKYSLLNIVFLAVLFSCNSDLNVGVSNENSDLMGQDLVVSSPLSKEESLALLISQRGSQLSAGEVQDKIMEGWNNSFGSEVLGGFNTADIETIWINTGSEDSAESEAESIPLYVFQKADAEGFILASGDVRLPDVLAWSPKGSYGTNTGTGLDVFNDLLRFYIKDSLPKFQAKYDSILLSAEAKVNLMQSGGMAISTRNQLLSGGGGSDVLTCFTTSSVTTLVHDIGPFIDVKWGQGYPYDKFCPDLGCTINQGHALVGCVAVACAQIMSHHKYPSSLGGTIFNWNSMTAYPYISSLSATYQDQIAHLMHYTADGVLMDYGCAGSISDISHAKSYLNNIGYLTDNICSYNISTIYSSLNNARPLYMRGNRIFINEETGLTEEAGHAWVIDGYKEIKTTMSEYFYVCETNEPVGSYIAEHTDKYVYFNFGWNGSYNAYYHSYVLSYAQENLPNGSYCINNLLILPNVRH